MIDSSYFVRLMTYKLQFMTIIRQLHPVSVLEKNVSFSGETKSYRINILDAWDSCICISGALQFQVFQLWIMNPILCIEADYQN